AFNGEHKAATAVGGLRLNAEQQRGRDLFAERCSVCHTLAAVKSVARVGPNLDVRVGEDISTASGRKALVENAIAEGRARGLGQLKSFSVNAQELDDAFEAGMGFDGSSVTGFNAIEESDMIAMPDASTFAVLPWRPEEQGVGRMFCDVITPERTPYEGDPRHVLRRALERANAMGFDTFNVGPELEYYLFRDSRSTDVLDLGGYFDLTTLDAGSDVRRETV